MTLTDLKSQWRDEPDFHAHINDLFRQLTTADPELDAQRTYVEERVWGMGERSFPYLWKIILEEVPENATLLEIGVHKGQVLSLWKLLKPSADVFGITPLDGRGTGWTEDDYAGDIAKIHDDFGLEQPTFFVGASQEPGIIEMSSAISPYDVVYIDGSHTYQDCLDDLNNYAPMVRPGGFLVIDDCNCDLNFPPSGFFTGIDTVTEAKKKWLETQEDFEFWGSCVHISYFRRRTKA